MAVFPERMDRLDANDLGGSLSIIENYIRYMGERIEFAMRNTTRDVNEVGTSSVGLYQLIMEVSNDLSTVASTVNSVAGNINSVNTRLAALQGDVDTVKKDLATVQSSITTINESVDGVKKDVATIKDDIDKTKEQIADLTERVTALEAGTEGTNGS